MVVTGRSVFQLPQRLRVAIDTKAYALAVDCYISARPVLKRAGYKVPRQALRHATLSVVSADACAPVTRLVLCFFLSLPMSA